MAAVLELPTVSESIAAPAPPERRWRRLIPVAGVLIVIAVLLAWRATAKAPASAFTLAPVQRTSVVKTISATGKTQALMTVQVGTQASGTVSAIYADFNTQVKKGQIIAQLDASQFQAQLTQANANLSSTLASVQSAQNGVLSADAAVEAAQANVDRNKAAVDAAQLTFDRTTMLVKEGVTARQDLDTARSNLNQAAAQYQQAIAQTTQAKAQAQSARSQVAQARAQIQQAQAAVQLANVNVEHTVIRAPIDGVVVARNVDVGQTVAASLQAPTLFLIANDLTHMQVLADIDEADVGQLAPDSEVTFTVDAYPSDTFRGHIAQIRLAPQTVQNVVTYTAVIDVPNPDLKLKPGMTANITAVVARRDNVLAIPNTALRFRPENAIDAPRGTVVWRVNGEKVEPVRVRLGLTNGIVSEVAGSDLHEGDKIAVPAVSGDRRQSSARTVNPMMPGGGGRVPRGR